MTIEVENCQGCIYLRNMDGLNVCVTSSYTPINLKKSCQTEGPVVKMPINRAKRVDQRNGARTKLEAKT